MSSRNLGRDGSFFCILITLGSNDMIIAMKSYEVSYV